MKKMKGIGVYSSSVPDKRDRLQHPGMDDGYVGSSARLKKRPVPESVLVDKYPVSGSSQALPKKP